MKNVTVQNPCRFDEDSYYIGLGCKHGINAFTVTCKALSGTQNIILTNRDQNSYKKD